jgi:hypothetical protein
VILCEINRLRRVRNPPSGLNANPKEFEGVGRESSRRARTPVWSEESLSPAAEGIEMLFLGKSKFDENYRNLPKFRYLRMESESVRGRKAQETDLGPWSLELPWCLEFGIWSLPGTARFPSPVAFPPF